MELRVLNYFLVVAETGSITAAAERLHIGQPTLSRQLKELELELGQRLFDREPHGVVLTREGERLRTYAYQMRILSKKIEEEFVVMRTNPMGDLYCGGVEGARFHRIARLVKRLRKLQPNIRFHYHAGSYSTVTEMLDRGVLDFGIVYHPGDLGKYESLQLPDPEKWVAFLRADHPLAGKSALTPDDLCHEPLLMYDQIMRMPYEINEMALWFAERFQGLNVVGTSNLNYANDVMAREGLGIFLTWECFTTASTSDEMVVVPLDPPLIAQITLIWRGDRPLSPTAEYFLSAVRTDLLQNGHALKA